MVDGVRHFQPHLYGRQFTVLTNHAAVLWLMNIKEPTGRLARWALLLQQHDFTIQHRSGVSNGTADTLSGRHYDSVVASMDKPGVQIERVREIQHSDPTLADIITCLESSRLPNTSAEARAIMHSIDDYYLDPYGLLCHLWVPKGQRVPSIKSQLVVPPSLRDEILVGGHDDPLAGHLGVNKTYEKLREHYYWPKMFADVQFWYTSCTHCQMKKSPKQRQTAPILPISVESAFDRVAVDCLGPFPVSDSGNRYIVVFSDYLTRYPEAFSVPSIDAPTMADLLVNHIMPRHGAPRRPCCPTEVLTSSHSLSRRYVSPPVIIPSMKTGFAFTKRKHGRTGKLFKITLIKAFLLGNTRWLREGPGSLTASEFL